MSPTQFTPIPMNAVASAVAAGESAKWLWHGYVARGSLTLLTSLWKAGKTTLISGLLQKLDVGGRFLDQPCCPAKTLIISEESMFHWVPRLALMPIGPHVQLLARPFLRRPTPTDWEQLIEQATAQCTAGELDLLIVDSLAAFLPGRAENDAATLLEMLQPLQRLATTGAAVLLLHHPRKQRSEEGHTARGSGALLAFVDIILELHRFGRMSSDACTRKLIGLSRFRDTPARLIYQWDPATGTFARTDDIGKQRFQENWPTLKAILSKRTIAATHHELLADWPSDQPAPPACVLYEWLNRATEMKRVRRQGQGRRLEPYRYRLPNDDDPYYDRGELPPLRDLPFLSR